MVSKSETTTVLTVDNQGHVELMQPLTVADIKAIAARLSQLSDSIVIHPQKEGTTS